MAWTKLDDSVYDHPKLNELDDPAHALLWIWSLCWANRYGTNGFLPRKSMAKLADSAHATDFDEAAAELTRVGLWEEADGGWEVHDFLVYNPSAEEVADLSRKRSDAGRRGGLRSGEARSKPEASASKDPKQTGKPLPKQNRSPSRPVPSITSLSSSGLTQQEISTGQDDDEPIIDLNQPPPPPFDPPPPPDAPTTDHVARAVALELGRRDSHRSPSEVRVPAIHVEACARTRWAVQAAEIVAIAAQHPEATVAVLADLVEAQAVAMAAHPAGGHQPPGGAPPAPPRPACGTCGKPAHQLGTCPWEGMTRAEIDAELEAIRRDLEERGDL